MIVENVILIEPKEYAEEPYVSVVMHFFGVLFWK